MVNVHRTLLLPLLGILCFLGVEVSEVLFGVEQDWEMNCEFNYQLINSRGVTKGVQALCLSNPKNLPQIWFLGWYLVYT